MQVIETFKRGQVVWAVWRAFSRVYPPSREPVPKSFETRVRKMGELGVPLSEEERPGQSGIDIEYTGYNAFELAVALTCQDNGFKQSEVAFFISKIRSDLRVCYDRIMASRPSPGEPIKAKDRPNSPRRMVIRTEEPTGLGDPSRAKLADLSCFMLFRYVEIRKAWGSGNRHRPYWLKPRFCYGLTELAEEMDRIANTPPESTRIVIELSNLAVIVASSLKEAPTMRRGRQFGE